MADHDEADLSAWQLEFARLFAYPAKTALVMEQRWWQDLAGQPADFESLQTMQSRKVTGTFSGARLSLTIDPDRIIWEVQPASKVGDLPTLGPSREKLNWVVELLTPWLANSCPPIRRLAFGGKLLQAAATQREAFRVLAAHLPGVKLEPNPNDFILQINRRTSSSVVQSLPINRVCTWGKMNVMFSVKPGVPFEWPEKCYSALELDINTAPENTDILPPQLLPSLLRELADHAVTIAERGDVHYELREHAK
jgi:hypothetical protein